ncbi:MAG: YsnF/AvaK domain-containing protein [Candidatus Eremiobacteraeota bacterium]|nr:YsnF/AvaK domain-containing protein [Candidatus Eremiobacteraeota bacterium]MBC5825220.1 YsnF/AvaK domain-containing protein [Candidatus Eremiobacteraeota bacterium]
MDKLPDNDAATTDRAPYDEEIFSVPDLIDGERITLHAERLQPQKRRVQERVARIGKRVVTKRQRIEIEVDVLHEELCIEYGPGDGLEMHDEKPIDVRILLYAEQPEIVKVVRAVEEIHVTTRESTEMKRFGDTVQREVLDAEPARIA